MRVALLSPQSVEWRAALQRIDHDVYHLPEYAILAASHDGGEPVAFLAEESEEALLLPLLLREVPSATDVLGRRALDATSPYGYPGPIVSQSGSGKRDFIVRAVAQLTETLRARGVLSAFVRLHPLLPFPTELLSDVGEVVRHGQTIAIDLHASPDELQSQIKKTHRRFIRMIERSDHRMIITESATHIDDFLTMYRENMDRVHASPYYYFSREYFERMFSSLTSRVHLAFLEVEHQLVCVDLLTEVGGIIECHVGATRAAHLRTSPSIALTYYECLWAKERGNRLLHLGGGVGGKDDSLFAFKAGFTKLRFPFSTWRLVIDQPSYDTLVLARGPQAGTAADPANGFFPAYREPLAS